MKRITPHFKCAIHSLVVVSQCRLGALHFGKQSSHLWKLTLKRPSPLQIITFRRFSMNFMVKFFFQLLTFFKSIFLKVMALFKPKPGEKNCFQSNKRRLPPIESIGNKIRLLGISLSNDLKVGKVKVSVPFKFDVNLIFILQSTNSSQFRNVTFVTFSQKITTHFVDKLVF